MLLIGANLLVSIWEWLLPSESGRALVQQAALIPARLSGTATLPGISPPLTLITSQFLHAGPVHLGGNMLFLWIFGNNVEDELGAFRFLVFYLVAGIGAGLVHFATAPASLIPTVGASGAISGVLGAYAVLFPKARIHTLIFLLFYISVIPIPALLWVGIWFAIQILQGFATQGSGGGVAWFAHVGGLLTGVCLLPLLRPRGRPRRIAPFNTSWQI
jgi:membrane associated rhomboid family serine protease